MAKYISLRHGSVNFQISTGPFSLNLQGKLYPSNPFRPNSCPESRQYKGHSRKLFYYSVRPLRKTNRFSLAATAAGLRIPRRWSALAAGAPTRDRLSLAFSRAYCVCVRLFVSACHRYLSRPDLGVIWCQSVIRVVSSPSPLCPSAATRPALHGLCSPRVSSSVWIL